MITLANVSVPLDAGLPKGTSILVRRAASALGIAKEAIATCEVVKRSVDARKKDNVHFVVSLNLELDSEEREEALLANPPKGVSVRKAKPYTPLEYQDCASKAQDAHFVAPVVVGAGPAGLFAALYLARCGLRPVLVERGAPVEQRIEDIEQFKRTGVLDPSSNVQFGEGGAGTFSDGKLTTNVKNPLTRHVLRLFVEAGAPEEILVVAHPHLGSDNLPGIVSAIRNEIIERGGQVLFHTCVSGFEFEAGRIAGVRLRPAYAAGCAGRADVEAEKAAGALGEERLLAARHVVLACGHSARDVFELCRDAGLEMERKPFSVGVRIEHPQRLINESQWGKSAHHPALGAAEYKLAVHLPEGRSVYTFCMCPGGEVVAAASEEGGVVTNGMSNFARAGENANSAVLVSVEPSDFPGTDVLGGVELQRSIEKAAFDAAAKRGGAPYQAPAQTVGAFLGQGGPSPDQALCAPTYGRGVMEVPLEECLPDYVVSSLKSALPLLDRKLHGFAHPGALMTAPETRSSSPVRLCRNEQLQAQFAGSSEDAAPTGLYPCGEGPGYAGGIMSAAVDGLRVAQAVAREYA